MTDKYLDNALKDKKELAHFKKTYTKNFGEEPTQANLLVAALYPDNRYPFKKYWVKALLKTMS